MRLCSASNKESPIFVLRKIRTAHLWLLVSFSSFFLKYLFEFWSTASGFQRQSQPPKTQGCIHRGLQKQRQSLPVNKAQLLPFSLAPGMQSCRLMLPIEQLQIVCVSEVHRGKSISSSPSNCLGGWKRNGKNQKHCTFSSPSRGWWGWWDIDTVNLGARGQQWEGGWSLIWGTSFFFPFPWQSSNFISARIEYSFFLKYCWVISVQWEGLNNFSL